MAPDPDRRRPRRRPRPWPWPPPPPSPWYTDSRGVVWSPVEYVFGILLRSSRTETLGSGSVGMDDVEIRAEAIDVIERWAVRHP